MLSEFTIDVFNQISGLRVKPFLVGGSLLGYYSNKGFIPWDDDLDFGLFRDDYQRLIDFGKNYMLYLEIGASVSVDNLKKTEEVMREHPDELIMLVSPNCLQIKRGNSEIDATVIDFFPYDYYRNDYPFEEHTKLLNDLNQYRYTEIGNSFFQSIIRDKEITVTESENVYFGIDNLDSFTCKNEEWIKKEIIEPLQPCVFEKIPCYAPNMPEELLGYFYHDFMELPNEFSSHHRKEISENILKKEYLFCGIYIKDLTNVDDALIVYKDFRKNGIYCVFFINWLNAYVEKALNSYNVEICKDNTSSFDMIVVDEDFEKRRRDSSMILRKKMDSYHVSKMKTGHIRDGFLVEGTI
jgi:lipopolysaccharide cholinephosphotransferase